MFQKDLKKIEEKTGVLFRDYNKEHLFIYDDRQYYYMVITDINNFTSINKIIFKVFNNYAYEFAFEVRYIEKRICILEGDNSYGSLINFLGIKEVY